MAIKFRLILFLLFAAQCHGQVSPSEFWLKTLKTRSLVEISKLTESTGVPKWPYIPFVSAQRGELCDLANIYKLKLAAITIPDGPLAEIAVQLRSLVSVAKMLREAGGYTNVLLADSSYRIAVGNLTLHVLRHPSDFAPSSDLLNELRFQSLSTTTAGTLIQEGLGNPDAVRILERAGIGEVLVTSFQLCGVTSKQVIWSLGEKGTTSAMLKTQQTALLILRLASADLVAAYSLPGLLRFLGRGGALKDMESDNIDAYYRVMGPVTRDFSFPPMGLKELTAMRLRSLIDEFTDPLRFAFLRLAVE